MSTALSQWRRPRAIHDPAKILLDAAVAVAAGGDCLTDVEALRAEPGVFGPVASAATVWRLIDTLAAAGPAAIEAIRAVRSVTRQRVWSLAGDAAPDGDQGVSQQACKPRVDQDRS